jgi:hypothetical protein
MLRAVYRRLYFLARPLCGLFLLLAPGVCLSQNRPASSGGELLSQSGATLTVPDSEIAHSLSIVVYGDMRFTDPSNTKVANPQARRLLAEKVASEHPDALELTGDVPYAGGNPADYDEYRSETAAWRAAKLRVYPALGNHELVGDTQKCLANWWTAFPELKDRRWYSVQLGKRVYLINLDSNFDLTEESRQMLWLHDQIEHLPKSVDFVFVAMHHPAVADKQTLEETDHNPRPNEIAVRDYLSRVAPQSHAKFIVATGHIHNYERLEVDGVTYLVSGGGGAHPYGVERTAADQYKDADAINFHYILFRLNGKELRGTMYRLADPAAPAPEWQTRDSFVIAARP